MHPLHYIVVTLQCVLHNVRCVLQASVIRNIMVRITLCNTTITITLRYTTCTKAYTVTICTCAAYVNIQLLVEIYTASVATACVRFAPN